jgi:hypothetical protein
VALFMLLSLILQAMAQGELQRAMAVDGTNSPTATVNRDSIQISYTCQCPATVSCNQRCPSQLAGGDYFSITATLLTNSSSNNIHWYLISNKTILYEYPPGGIGLDWVNRTFILDINPSKQNVTANTVLTPRLSFNINSSSVSFNLLSFSYSPQKVVLISPKKPQGNSAIIPDLFLSILLAFLT